MIVIDIADKLRALPLNIYALKNQESPYSVKVLLELD